MGKLEELRDLLSELVREGEDLALFDEAAMDWHNAGSPGYEPEPWGAPGVVPTKPGRYDVHAPGMGRPRVWELLPSQLWSNGRGQRYVSADSFPPDVRFRWLAEAPTWPKDT